RASSGPVPVPGGGVMELLWFGTVAGMLAVYVVLDGYDLGAGAVHLFVARNDLERRMVLAAIGPYWDGNEVWLIAGGGALFMAFPIASALGFSAFYPPRCPPLWCSSFVGCRSSCGSTSPIPSGPRSGTRASRWGAH